MPYLPTAQSWLQNSALLLSARPTTTRITTKYTILRPRSSDSSKKASRPSKSKSATSAPAPAAGSALTSHHQPTKAVLVLKTYDPVSGTCLKYRTDKAADVGRLIAALGTCGRVMAALPEKEKGTEKDEDGGEGGGAAEAKGKLDGSEVLPARGGEKEKEGKGKAGASGGGGTGKKKKGKR
ncbi:hypothetical protein MMC22_006315 [Lobaria immixta]|nr:hypothetical protein [Lobaria immixta]